MEHGYRFAIVLAITSDAAAITLLTLFLVRARSSARGRGAAPPHERSGAPPTREPGKQRPVVPATET